MIKQITNVWAIAVVAMGILGLTAGVVNAAPAIGIDVGDGVWDDGGEENANGLQITATSFGTIATGNGEKIVTVDGITFTFNIDSAEYVGAWQDRSEILGSVNPGRYTGPVPWSLTGLVPGGLYDIAFLMLNGRPGTWTIDGVGSATPDADSDSNFEDVRANGSGVISGTWDYWTISAWCSFTALLVEYTEVVVPDGDAPSISTLSPTNTATDVLVDANLVITFDEDVQKGSGNIVIKDIGGGTFETIDVTTGLVTVDGAAVTINPSADLGYSTNYYVEITSGAIKDLWSTPNDFGGFSGSATWSFTTENPDSIPPDFTTLSPTNGASGVAPASNMVITFDEEVQKGTGNIVIKEIGGATFETIDVTTGLVTVDGSNVTINPTSDLGYGTNYYVEIANTAITDLAAPPNAFTGFTGSAAWNFTTELPDTTAPDFTTLSPTNNATDVVPAADLVMTFDEPVQKGAGNIVIKESGGATFETIDVTSGNVTVSGSDVTIDPVGALAAFTDYYVEIDAGAIKDQGLPTPVNYGGISGDSTWSFRTGKTPTVISIDFDKPQGGVQSGEPTHSVGLTIPGQAGSWYQLVKGASGSSPSITTPGGTFTFNTTGASYRAYNTGSHVLREDFFWLTDGYGPCTWTLTDLVPGATYDIIMYGRRVVSGNYRGADMTIVGYNDDLPLTQEAGANSEGDWNAAGVEADATGTITGIFAWNGAAHAEFCAIQFDKVGDPIPLGMVFILK